jgi:ubiquitin-conjugating enzyme E2 Q
MSNFKRMFWFMRVKSNNTSDAGIAKVVPQKSTKSTASHYLLDPTKTKFSPGTVELSTLPLLSQPSNATRNATKILSKSIKEIMKVQATTPQHELGWYIDPENTGNLYQWFVE